MVETFIKEAVGGLEERNVLAVGGKGDQQEVRSRRTTTQAAVQAELGSSGVIYLEVCFQTLFLVRKLHVSLSSIVVWQVEALPAPQDC